MLSIAIGQDKIGYSLDKEKENCKSLYPSGMDCSQQYDISKKTYDTNGSDEFVKILMTLHQQKNVVMDESWLHLTSLASERILLHLDDLAAVDSLCEELWSLGKRLKQENGTKMENNKNSGGIQHQAVYGKAILVTIYHCRASIHYHQRDWARAIIDCRKCLTIDSQTDMLMSSDSLLLQKVELLKENASSMLEQGLQYQRRCLRSDSISSMASISTRSSSAPMMVCSFCSLKKRKMPVCAQCKYQAYCGIKCLKQDKVRHVTQCQPR